MAPGKKHNYLALPSFKRKRDAAFPSPSAPSSSREPPAGPTAGESSAVSIPPTGPSVGGGPPTWPVNSTGWRSSPTRASPPKAWASQQAPAAEACSKPAGLPTSKPPQPMHNQYEAAPLDFEVVDPGRVAWCRPPMVRAMKKGPGKPQRFVLGDDEGEGEQGMYQLGRGEPSGGKIYFDRDLRRRLEVVNYTPPSGTLGIDRYGLPAPALSYFVRDASGGWKPVKASRWMYPSADPPAGIRVGDVAPRPRPEDLPIKEVESSQEGKGKGKAEEASQEELGKGDQGGVESSESDYGELTWKDVAGDPPSSKVLVVTGLEETVASIAAGKGLETLLAHRAKPVAVVRSQGHTYFELADVSAGLRAVHPLRRLWFQAIVEFTTKETLDRAWERFDELWMPEVEEGEVGDMDVDRPLVQPGAVNEARSAKENNSQETPSCAWDRGDSSVTGAWGGWGSGEQWGATCADAWPADPAASGWDLAGPGTWSGSASASMPPPSPVAEAAGADSGGVPEVEEGEVGDMDVDRPLVQPGAVNETRSTKENNSQETPSCAWDRGDSSATGAWGGWGSGEQWGATSADAWPADPAASGWDLAGPGTWSGSASASMPPPSQLIYSYLLATYGPWPMACCEQHMGAGHTATITNK
ncbi:hypothetical protein GGX14DRAFT_399895 [Mycena pura]|uniref:Uncharacterized protein n=1 Tax=Mycena pura TaxID=153505 RepID=A0AAD6V5N4_9AGAR|nr:hypothetical protein GGX14DRAFT_399895 [Mycena pura]